MFVTGSTLRAYTTSHMSVWTGDLMHHEIENYYCNHFGQHSIQTQSLLRLSHKYENCCLVNRILQNFPRRLTGTINYHLVIFPTVIVTSELESMHAYSLYQKWFCQHFSQTLQQKLSVLSILSILSKYRNMRLTRGINYPLFEYRLENFHDDSHDLSPEGDFIDH